MGFKKIKPQLQGKNTDVNGEGNEKDDTTSTTKNELASLTVHDNNAKTAGLANGWRQRPQ